MPEHDTLMAQLKEATWPQHQAAEEHEVERALVAGTLPRAAYAEWLGQRYLVHNRLEPAVAELAANDPRVGTFIEPRLFQAENLRDDVLFFGAAPDAIEPLPATQAMLDFIDEVQVQDSLALIGIYYVFEGSKNGARFIARAIRPAYGLNGTDGTKYLDPHGDQQRPLWIAFREKVNAVDIEKEKWPNIIAAAQATFDHVRAMDGDLAARTPSLATAGTG